MCRLLGGAVGLRQWHPADASGVMEEGCVSPGQISCKGARQAVCWRGELLCHALSSDGRHESLNGLELPLAQDGFPHPAAEKVSDRLADYGCHSVAQVPFQDRARGPLFAGDDGHVQFPEELAVRANGPLAKVLDQLAIVVER
eukprot:8959594-Heterocapsa_arctica.AAC.1